MALLHSLKHQSVSRGHRCGPGKVITAAAVPFPLHPRGYRVRGIARSVAGSLGILEPAGNRETQQTGLPGHPGLGASRGLVTGLASGKGFPGDVKADALDARGTAADVSLRARRPCRVHDIYNCRAVDGSWVSDVGRRLTQGELAEVNEACARIFAEYRAEVCVVLLDGFDSSVQSPSAFVAALMNFWGVGDKILHSGLLVLLCFEEPRRLEMRTGFGTTKVLPKDVMARVQAERMVPWLRKGELFEALLGGLAGVRSELDTRAPPRWRREHGGQTDDEVLGEEQQVWSFGGGQTSVEEFLPPS